MLLGTEVSNVEDILVLKEGSYGCSYAPPFTDFFILTRLDSYFQERIPPGLDFRPVNSSLLTVFPHFYTMPALITTKYSPNHTDGLQVAIKTTCLLYDCNVYSDTVIVSQIAESRFILGIY